MFNVAIGTIHSDELMSRSRTSTKNKRFVIAATLSVIIIKQLKNVTHAVKIDVISICA